MIVVDNAFVLDANEVILPLLERGDDGQQFFVLDITVDFGGCKLTRIECYGVKLVVIAILVLTCTKL